jgi:hypothetical protein
MRRTRPQTSPNDQLIYCESMILAYRSVKKDFHLVRSYGGGWSEENAEKTKHISMARYQ